MLLVAFGDFREFDQDVARRFGINEDDAAAAMPCARFPVEQLYTLTPQLVERCVDIVDLESQME